MFRAIFFAVAFWLPSYVALVTRDLSHSGPPHNSNVVILLRGETFREEEHGERFSCNEFARPSQLNDTISVVQKLIEPLEQFGNKVDVVVTDHPCPLTKEVIEIYGKRVVASASFQTAGQAENMRRALDTLNAKCGDAEEVSEKYDYVLVLRHDARFVLEFDDWKADWSTINFFARCEDTAAKAYGGDNCVWDTLHVVPGKFYDIFNRVIGCEREVVTVDGEKRAFQCFSEGHDPNGHGHACYYPMLAALQETDKKAKLGLIFDERFRVRAPNPYLGLKLPHGDMPPPEEWRAFVPTDVERLK